MRVFLTGAALAAATVLQMSSATAGEALGASTFGSEADLVAAVMPSFVNFSIRRVAPIEGSNNDVPVIQDEVGSGFVVDPSGMIITNRHVVDGAYAITATFADGARFPAKLVGKALNFDFAVVKIDAGRPLQPVKLGNSETMRVGDRVVAIGNPLGYESSASSGIVSAFHRQIGLTAFDDVIQTDATINQGNSGGPLFNMKGEVIGVNQAIRRENGGGSIGIGFAIPVAQIEFILDNLKIYGRPRIGWFGVQGQTFTGGMAAVMQVSGGGEIVSGVTPGSPADKAGLQVGDVIRKVGSHTIETTSALSRAVAASVDQTLPVEILRNGQATVLTATFPEAPQAMWSTKMDPLPDVKALSDLGFTMALGDGAPVVAAVIERSIAWNAGLRKGDIIQKVWPGDVRSSADLLAIFQDNMARRVTNTLVFLGGPNGSRWVQFSILE